MVNVMKKLFSLSALSLVLLSGNALAANGEIRFVGAVTNVTCNVVPSVNGSTNNVVQLGTASLSTPATAVNFSLKSDGLNDCDSIEEAGNVVISFAGSLTEDGLANQSGLATDAFVQIKSVNATETDSENSNAIKSGDDRRTFAGALFKTAAADGAKFTAQLHGKTAKGDYQSAISFAVAYM